MSMEVVRAIEEVGAVVIYSAPYSPDLNPIENYFSVYKRYLRKYGAEMERNWEMIHLQAMNQVNRSMGIKYFRRCGIPGAMNIKTAEEIKSEAEDEAALLLLPLLTQL